MKVKWGVIGGGGIADRRAIPAILKDQDSELVAIFEKVPERAKELKEKYGVECFTDLEQMLSIADIDAVYIGTPVGVHYEQAMLALKYGKHAFIEKPLAMNESESEKIVGAYKLAGKQLTVGYMMKYHNLHVKAKEIVSGGGIGKINDIRVQFSCWYPDISGAWRQKRELSGGGVIIDLGVHAIELIEYLLDQEIVDVKSFYSTRTFSYPVEDGGVIIFRTADGVLGHIDVNFNIPDNASESKVELYGDKGYVVCYSTLSQTESGRMTYLYAPQGDYAAMQNRAVDKPVEYLAENGDLYLKQIKEFVNCVKNSKPDYFYADRAVQVQKVVDKIYADNV